MLNRMSDLPPLLYLPASGEDDGDISVVYRRTRDGRQALLAYTALDRLHASCGTGQPWTIFPKRQLDLLHSVEPFDLVLTDIVLPEDLRVRGQDVVPLETEARLQHRRSHLPPILYVPTARDAATADEADLLFLAADDGSLGLPAFTALDRLRRALGSKQAWLVIETRALEALRQRSGFTRLLVDEEISVHAQGGRHAEQ